MRTGRSRHVAVNPEAAKGRAVVLIISAGLLIPSAALFALSRPPRGTSIVRLAIAVAMSFLLVRGYAWARGWIALGLTVGGLFAAGVGLLVALRVWWGFPFLLLPPFYFWAAWTLWRSASVEAYVAHCERKRNPDMSLSSGDPS